MSRPLIQKQLAVLVLAALSFTAGVAVVTPARAAAPAADASAAKASLVRIVLSTGVVDGKMVFLDSHGKPVTQLQAKVGDTVEVTLSSGEGAQHDFAIPELKVASAKVDAKSGPTKVRFKLTQAGKFTFICTIPGHRQIGMEGVLTVTGGPAKPAAKAASAVLQAKAEIAPAKASAVGIAANPNAVPPVAGLRAPQEVKYRIETVELEGRLADGTTFTYWTFDKTVPGPMLRVREGDTVELALANAADSKMVHSIDLHAVTGGMGGGEHTQVPPGQERTIRFKAMKPGLYVYHCATPNVPHHISAGMYGLILVEPEGGLAKVDREFYVMQGELYTQHKNGSRGHQEFSVERMDEELADYYTFNGAVGALNKEHRMEAKVGETVRIYFGVGGPNKVSSFHVIGEIFDKVYPEAALNLAKHNVQTTLVAPGGATIVEFKVDYPGKYLLVDHALSRAGKGAVGTLHVTGEADAAVYHSSAPADPNHTH
jgi:nitrite reductase (NO-forming)